MKIVIVLCSIASFAIAVPVHQENVFESSLSNQALSTKREKKSAFPDTPGLFPEHGIEKIPIHNSKKSSQSTSVEAKSFRRPIIIKRKLGYHVYRDSDEEMAYAEPGEKCREQVKFKLCDHEPVSSSKNGFKSPTFKCFNNHNTDNEMENSIKMAKEAVEHLQKDLKRMENFSPKIANPHIEDIESNTGLHHDIEIAREALEHIEQNFESKNLEVNKANDLQISKPQDEERLTRWREAIENIHKNFEIVKNIEDALKSDNHFSIFRSDSGKAVELQKPEHLERLNDNLENNEEAYNEDKILKSASNEDGNAHLTPKTEHLDDIDKDMGNDMFVSPTENREEKLLHSDSLKSDNNNKDSFLRSDVSEIESIKRISNAPQESIEYVPKKSLSEIPNYSEHEKTVNDHISDDYEFLPKVSSSSSQSLEKKLQIEEKKTFDKSELMMKTAFPDRDNRNLLIRMKPVKEILGNKKDREKAANSNEENINEYEEMFKSENENSPLERLSLLPSTNIETTSTDIENFKNAETGRDGKIYSDKYNNKVIENEENESKSYNTNMRLSNDQLEKTDQLSAAKYVTRDQDVSQSPNLFSLKEKERNALGGEENVQNEQKTHYTIKENHEFHDYLKDSDKEVNDEAHKRTDKYNNMKSSEVQDRKIDSQIIQNQELSKFSFLNDHSVKKFDKSELYKTVSKVSNEAISNDRDFKNQHSVEEETGISTTENKDANEDSKLQFSKSVPELYSDLKLSMPTETSDISDDRHSHQSGMRLSQTQNEKLQLNEHLKGDDHASTSFDKDNSYDDSKTQSFKSVLELKPNPKASLPTDKVEITNDEQSYREEASIKSSESQNKKMHLNENQELHEPLPIGLDIEHHAEERTWQSSKSVPELPYDPMLSMPTENVDITDDQRAHKEEAIMRLAESPNEKKQLDEIQEAYEPLTMGLDLEGLPEERTWQLSKSVLELPDDPMVTMATGKVDIIDDHHAHKGEASMRSSESKSEKLLLNEYQGEADHASTRLDDEYSSDNVKTQYLKSVPELQIYPIVPLLTDKVDITNDQHSHREEASMRSSENHNEKMQSNEYQELHEPLRMGSDFELHPEERTWQYSKSVPEQTSDSTVSMQTETIDITDDHHAHKEETNMRSSESQREKLQLNEHQDEPEHASTKLDIENNSEDKKSQFLKSVPELLNDPMVSMPTSKVDITDDQQAHKGEESTRSSESQSEKLQLNEYEEPEHAPITSFPTDKEDITNIQHLQGEEALMRSADDQYEKELSNENLGAHEPSPMGLDIERHPEDRTWPSSKSVPELPSDSMISMPIEKIDVDDDEHHAHKEEASMKSSESQNEKLALNEYQDEPEHVLSKLDIENSSDDMKSLFFKSVPELETHPLPLFPTDKVAITNNRNLQGEEMSMRSAEVQNEKYLSNENQEVYEPLPMGLDIERHPEERTWESSKSVPELPSDSIVSMHTKKTDITDDHHAHKEEIYERSSESQSEKLQLNEYQNEPEHASTKLDIENSPDDKKSQFLKSVPELLYDSLVSMPKEKVDITDDRHAHKEEPSMRSSESQSEKLELNEYQEETDHASTKLEIENGSDDKKSPLLKSVPELLHDSMVSMPKEKFDITDDRHAHKEEASMRSSESNSEKLDLNEYQDEPKHASTKSDIENNSGDIKFQFLKSVPDQTYDPIVSMPTERVDINNDQAREEKVSMRSSEIQNEKLELNEYQNELDYASTKLDIENSSDDKQSQFLKSVPELPHDPMVSLSMEKVDITEDHADHKGEAGMRSSENQSEKLEVNEYQPEPEHASMKLDIENNSDDLKPLFSKSVSDLTYDPMVSISTEKVDITNDQHARKEEPSMRLSEIQSEKLELNKYQDKPEHASSKLGIENSSDDGKSQFLKSVSELESYSLASFPIEKVDITNNRHLQSEEESMRSAEVKNEKNQEVHKLRPMELDIERHPEERTWESSKSVPEPPSDPMISMPMEKVDTPEDHYSYTGDASMRVSETNQGGHEPLKMRLDMINRPEYRKWQVSKSVPELPFDSMVSMPTDKVETTYDQKSLTEENMRLSQNQNEGIQFHESHGLQNFFPPNLGIESHPEYRTQFYKSATPELYTTRSHINHVNNENSYFPEDARLSQSKNERQQMYFNQHLYEPLSSRTDNEKKIEDESWTTNKVRFSYMQNPMKEETNMRLSQNENEMKEILYPSRNLGLSNEHMNREENAEHMNDFMHQSVAQQLHDNRNPMLRWSNERQHLSHDFKSWPEHKMLPLTSQFELSNGQNFPNEYMRMNEQQSRDPEPMENQSSLSMRWNTANQHQDPSSKTFKFNTDYDHTLHKSNEFDKQQFIPHEASKSANTLEYRTKSQLFGDRTLDDTQSSRWYQTKQNNDHFANYYKTLPEGHEEYMNPHFRNHLHRVAVNHNLNDADTLGIHDSPSNRARLHEHMLKYHQEKSPNLDSSMDPSMHMSMGEPFAKSGTEFNNMNFNHPHGTARFGAGLPIAGVNSGAVGVFPAANAGGCGIPLFLSCNPSVVSGSLGRPHIGGPILKSVDENFKYYMKRDAKNVADIPDMKIQKASFPHNYGTGATSEI